MNTAPIAPSCLVCGRPGLLRRIDFGDQPICNRYLSSATEGEARFQRTLTQCPKCGLLQFEKPIPAMELRPRLEAARFGEPEAHLDQLVVRILDTITLAPNDVIYGLSYKDQSTLERFKARGFDRTATVEIARDLGDASPTAGIETTQALFDEERAACLANKYGKARVLILRRFIEHVHDFARFARAARALLAADGLLVVEEPDVSLPLELLDYSTIWEERTVFFTPATLRAALPALGFATLDIYRHPYPLEHALIAITRPGTTTGNSSEPTDELRKGEQYANAYPHVRKRTREFLEDFRKQNGPVAIFGAGHMACNFINLLGLADVIDFAVDDHPKKRGLFLPGSRLPILGSNALVEREAKLCLLTVRPEIEEAVIRSQAEYQEKRGNFASILPNGPRSLRRLLNMDS